jgi:glucose dehydrogenase
VPAPVVVGDLAVVVGRRSVAAVDLGTGAEAWTVERALGPSVPAAAGTVEDGLLLLVTEGGGEGDTTSTPTPTPTATATGEPAAGADLEVTSVLLGLDASTGERRWEHPLGALSRTGAAVVGETAFVGTDAGDVIAVDMASGDELWSARAGEEVRLPLAATDDLVLVATTSSSATGTSELVALDAADGQVAWRHGPGVTGVVVGSPSVGEGASFVTMGDRTVESVDLQDGTLNWSATMNQAGGTAPVLLEDAVVTLDVLGQVYAFDPDDGHRLWDHALNVAVFGPPIATPDAILVPSDGGAVSALDPSTGDLISRINVGDGFVLGLAAASEVVVVSQTGTEPGLAGLEHDDAGSLVRIPSPTIADPPALIGAWAIAAIPTSIALLLLGRMLWRRLGPPDLPEGIAEGDEVEVADR